MKIRIMGSEDVVRAWAKRFGQILGVAGDFYPMRGGAGVRWYADVDDRFAAELAQAPTPPPAEAPIRRRRSR